MKTANGPLRLKKSFSISVEAQNFVRNLRKERKISSDSATVDQILLESMAAHKRNSVDAAYKAYYDSASDADLAEENAWAKLSRHLIIRTDERSVRHFVCICS